MDLKKDIKTFKKARIKYKLNLLFPGCENSWLKFNGHCIMGM